jgi:hypothetical protein
MYNFFPTAVLLKTEFEKICHELENNNNATCTYMKFCDERACFCNGIGFIIFNSTFYSCFSVFDPDEESLKIVDSTGLMELSTDACTWDSKV